jgi:hypothetical protein
MLVSQREGDADATPISAFGRDPLALEISSAEGLTLLTTAAGS